MVLFAQLCRLCMDDNTELKSIYSSEEATVTISDKIKTVCDIMLNKNDCLPNTVCITCLALIESFYEFKIKCLHTNLLFENYIEGTTSKKELGDDVRRKLKVVCKAEEPSSTQVQPQSPITTEIESKVAVEEPPEQKTDSDESESTLPEPYRCPLCKKHFKSAYNKRLHMKTHTKDNQWLCNSCGKKFSSKLTLANHQIIHDGTKPFLCQLCGDRFADASTLKSHQAKHTEGKPFSCDLCPSSFKWKKSLYSHRRLHTDPPPKHPNDTIGWPCDICGKLLGRRNSLYKHRQLVHTTLRPFQCNICGKTFKDKTHLKTHMLYHEGKKVTCTICGKNYMNEAVLANHMRLHTGERPYACDMCEKSFADRSTLKSHKISHINEKSEKCPHCEFQCKHKKYLKLHLKKIHPFYDIKEENSQEVHL